jgi:predicted transcriptional regulator
MELILSPEEEQKLSEIAAHAGTNSPALVKSTILRLIEKNDQFRAAVRQGIAEADSGQWIEEAEMDALFESMIRD